MRKVITMQERISVRAYYLSLTSYSMSAERNWLYAEQVELQALARRKAAAAKGAATRKANTWRGDTSMDGARQERARLAALGKYAEH